MNYRLWTRIALGYLTAMALQIGVWALLAPRSFYDDYPGLGRAWVSVDGPFNEHLIRDVGALNLALAAMLLAAAITLSRALVVAVAVASLTWAFPISSTTWSTKTGSTAPTWRRVSARLAVAVLLPVALIAVSPRLEPHPT